MLTSIVRFLPSHDFSQWMTSVHTDFSVLWNGITLTVPFLCGVSHPIPLFAIINCNHFSFTFNFNNRKAPLQQRSSCNPTNFCLPHLLYTYHVYSLEKTAGFMGFPFKSILINLAPGTKPDYLLLLLLANCILLSYSLLSYLIAYIKSTFFLSFFLSPFSKCNRCRCCSCT